MDLFDYVIIGSGPSGVSAARRLAGLKTCIMDVGETAQAGFDYQTLSQAKASGDVQALLGQRFEMLSTIQSATAAHPKLRAPGVRHIMQGIPFHVRDANGETIVRGAGSYAKGGMSNAWGAQLLRYSQADLSHAGHWPFKASVLEAYYDDLEKHIGISGEQDDLYPFLGAATDLMPPSPLVPSARHILQNYKTAKEKNRKFNLLLGRARLAIHTVDRGEQSAYPFGETEFFISNQGGLYTAGRTLDQLRSSSDITYMGGHELCAFEEKDDCVELTVLDRSSGTKRTVRTRHLLLGCGTLQTARLVLLNKKGSNRSLPFMDHPPTLLPLFIPAMFGHRLPANSFPVQLAATLDGVENCDMISLYYPGAMLRSDLIPDIPLPARSSIRLMNWLLSGMLVAQIWETSRPSTNRLSLDENSDIVIDYPDRPPYGRLGKVISAFRALGAYSHRSLATMSLPGWGFHYAGCLPMRQAPSEFETHVDGRLWDSRRVRVIDGSVLPSLPGKNHSLTMMANAARIADEARQCGY